MSEPLAARLRRLEQQIAAFTKLHADELQLVLEELRDIAAQVEAAEAAPTAPPDADPAASSPKRAQWLAEQERRQHLSRRDLLRGREDPT